MFCTSAQVRSGQLGGNKQKLSARLREAILCKWREVVLPATGFENYDDMRRSINKELRRPFKSTQA